MADAGSSLTPCKEMLVRLASWGLDLLKIPTGLGLVYGLYKQGVFDVACLFLSILLVCWPWIFGALRRLRPARALGDGYLDVAAGGPLPTLATLKFPGGAGGGASLPVQASELDDEVGRWWAQEWEPRAARVAGPTGAEQEQLEKARTHLFSWASRRSLTRGDAVVLLRMLALRPWSQAQVNQALERGAISEVQALLVADRLDTEAARRAALAALERLAAGQPAGAQRELVDHPSAADTIRWLLGESVLMETELERLYGGRARAEAALRDLLRPGLARSGMVGPPAPSAGGRLRGLWAYAKHSRTLALSALKAPHLMRWFDDATGRRILRVGAGICALTYLGLSVATYHLEVDGGGVVVRSGGWLNWPAAQVGPAVVTDLDPRDLGCGSKSCRGASYLDSWGRWWVDPRLPWLRRLTGFPDQGSAGVGSPLLVPSSARAAYARLTGLGEGVGPAAAGYCSFMRESLSPWSPAPRCSAYLYNLDVWQVLALGLPEDGSLLESLPCASQPDQAAWWDAVWPPSVSPDEPPPGPLLVGRAIQGLEVLMEAEALTQATLSASAAEELAAALVPPLWAGYWRSYADGLHLESAWLRLLGSPPPASVDGAVTAPLTAHLWRAYAEQAQAHLIRWFEERCAQDAPDVPQARCRITEGGRSAASLTSASVDPATLQRAAERLRSPPGSQGTPLASARGILAAVGRPLAALSLYLEGRGGDGSREEAAGLALSLLRDVDRAQEDVDDILMGGIIALAISEPDGWAPEDAAWLLTRAPVEGAGCPTRPTEADLQWVAAWYQLSSGAATSSPLGACPVLTFNQLALVTTSPPLGRAWARHSRVWQEQLLLPAPIPDPATGLAPHAVDQGPATWAKWFTRWRSRYGGRRLQTPGILDLWHLELLAWALPPRPVAADRWDGPPLEVFLQGAMPAWGRLGLGTLGGATGRLLGSLVSRPPPVFSAQEGPDRRALLAALGAVEAASPVEDGARMEVEAGLLNAHAAAPAEAGCAALTPPDNGPLYRQAQRDAGVRTSAALLSTALASAYAGEAIPVDDLLKGWLGAWMVEDHQLHRALAVAAAVATLRRQAGIEVSFQEAPLFDHGLWAAVVQGYRSPELYRLYFATP